MIATSNSALVTRHSALIFVPGRMKLATRTRRPLPRRRAALGTLGAGDATVVGITGGAGSIASKLLPALGVAGPVGLAIGLGAVAISLIFSFIGGGCGQACVEASQAEQVFEIAADIVGQAVVLGQITSAEGLALLQALLQVGTQQMTQLAATDSKAKAGLSNMTKVVNGIVGDVQNLNVTTPTAAVNPAAAIQAFVSKTNGAGWYGGPGGKPGNSWTQGQQLATQLIETVPPTPINTVVTTSGTTGTATPTGSIAAKLVAVADSPWFWPVAIGAGVLLLISL